MFIVVTGSRFQVQESAALPVLLTGYLGSPGYVVDDWGKVGWPV